MHQIWELADTKCFGRFAVRREGISWLRTLAGHLDKIEAGAGKSSALVFLSYLDLFLGRWIMPFDWRRVLGVQRFTGLIFHGEAAEGRRNRKWRRGPLASWALLHSSLCPAVATLNEDGAATLAEFLGQKPVLIFPDVAKEDSDTFETDSPLLKGIQSRAGGRPILALIGALDWRKGLEEFLQLAELLPLESWFLVCAGRVYHHTLTPQAASLLARAQAGDRQNLLLYDRWLTDAEFEAILHSATAVFAAYHGFGGSSNLLTKAAQTLKPVLVSEGGLMAQRVHRYQTGLALPEGDLALMVGILTSGKLQSLVSTPEFLSGCKRYCMDHSLARLRQMVGSLLAVCSSAST